MHRIEMAAGQVIASDTANSVDAVDAAVVALSRLCASIVEVSKASNLPVGTAQDALANTGEGLSRIIASRSNVSAATKELTLIQRRSTLRETGFGCPTGIPAEGSMTAESVTV